MLVGQILSVAGTDNLLSWVMAQQPRDKSNADGVRFERTGWKVNDESFYLSSAAILKL
jgi:hypothetical protein